jgi:hypothetical protein
LEEHSTGGGNLRLAGLSAVVFVSIENSKHALCLTRSGRSQTIWPHLLPGLPDVSNPREIGAPIPVFDGHHVGSKFGFQ